MILTGRIIQRMFSYLLFALIVAAPLPYSNAYSADLVEGFESGNIPSFLKRASLDASWVVTNERAHDSSRSFTAGPIESNGFQRFELFGQFDTSQISFYYFAESPECCLTLEVFIDGEQVDSVTLTEDGWQYYALSIEPGLHRIAFYIFGDFWDYTEVVVLNGDESSDPEPSTASQVWIDDLVITDVVTDDTDGDGIYTFNDNCTAVANEDQHDSDGDSIGDECDEDNDNDGLTDLQEIQYDFLNPYDHLDASSDQDLDGVGNAREIHFGFDPSSANDEFPVNLKNYFPLGEIIWKHLYQGFEGKIESVKTDKENVFVVSGSQQTGAYGLSILTETKDTLEVRDEGVFLLNSYRRLSKADNSSVLIENTRSFADGVVQIPFAIDLRTGLTTQVVMHVENVSYAGVSSSYDGTFNREIQVGETGGFSFNSTAVKMIELKVSDHEEEEQGGLLTSERNTLLLGEGVGRLNAVGFIHFTSFSEAMATLTDMTITSLYGAITPEDESAESSEKPSGETIVSGDPAAPRDNQGADSGGGGGGSTDCVLLLMLVLVVGSTRRLNWGW